MKKLAIWVPVLLMLALAAVPLGPFTFHSRSVCDRCGVVRQTAQKQLPFTRVTWLRSDREEPSEVSRVLDRLGAVPPHAHRWVFVQGSGNGIL